MQNIGLMETPYYIAQLRLDLIYLLKSCALNSKEKNERNGIQIIEPMFFKNQKITKILVNRSALAPSLTHIILKTFLSTL
jgi:hypothetical protein